MQYALADKEPIKKAQVQAEATAGAGEALERARSALRYDEFIWTVQREAGLLTPAAAALAARATLRTLADRLRAEADDPEEKRAAEELISSLSDALPGQLSTGRGELPGDGDPADGHSGTQFSMTEFFRRVGERTGVGLAEAERHARAAAITLDAAVSGRELDLARSRLPDEFELLFV